MHNISLLNKKVLIAILLPLLVLLGTSYTHAADRGDAGYREGGWLTFGSDHGGVRGNSGVVYEIKGYWGSGVVLSDFDSFKSGKTFYGFYTNPSITDTKRSYIISMVAAMSADPEITYTAQAQLMHDDHRSSAYVHVDEITDIRCDGVIEYAYEYNDVYVWGPSSTGTNSGNPTDFDISTKVNVQYHANLGYDEPWIEVSPRVQRGAATVNNPTRWTQLRPRTS
ncbi:hypothetical protein ACIFQM_14495 [Paenibacillus sp. NRS-1782]|uniref:hypothetical protein n=1 Tax=unclassified Paenibacillus TaxID=185978 RepID=UPI003D2CA302